MRKQEKKESQKATLRRIVRYIWKLESTCIFLWPWLS